MKRLLVVFICVSMITLTGCMKEYTLSEKNTDIMAEYMAGRLLETDKKYSPSLLSYHEITDLNKNTPETEQKPEPVEPTVAPDDQDYNNDDITPSDGEHYTLSEIIGDSRFDIQYVDSIFADTYPEDESNLVFSVDPREGYQLLVVNFSVENRTDKDETIDLSQAKIQYQLDINVGTIYKPQLALLENNLQYINLKVKAKVKIPAVLIFEVPGDIDMSDINLIVSRDKKTEIIEIK